MTYIDASHVEAKVKRKNGEYSGRILFMPELFDGRVPVTERYVFEYKCSCGFEVIMMLTKEDLQAKDWTPERLCTNNRH